MAERWFEEGHLLHRDIAEAGCQKENKMENGMTNEQFKIALKMIITIIEGSESKDDAVKKIKALLDE